MTLIKSISGIRGTIGGTEDKGLTPLDILKYTTSYAFWLKEQKEKPTVIVGRDARISGYMVKSIVNGALLGAGIDVIDVDLSTTPSVEMAVIDHDADGGIILTASHNPKQWNALKLLNDKGEFISASTGQYILDLAEKGGFEFPDIEKLGKYSEHEGSIDKHIGHITDLPLVDVESIRLTGFKVVVDAVNSSGGIAVPKLLNALGVEDVIVINGEPTGLFAHNPEPLAENLTELSSVVKRENAHLGISVDPDVDRLALVCEDGEMFGEEYTLVSVADYILTHVKGNVVSNLSSTQALKDLAEKHGCDYFPSAVGEVNVVEKMKEVNAVIGGEGNGGVIYPRLHHGRDALVGIALFLSHLANSKKSASMLRSEYPNYFMVKDKMAFEEHVKIGPILQRIEEKYQHFDITTVDGLKISMPDGWVMIRRSNTEPIVRVYAESHSTTTAENIVKQLKGDIRTFMT